MALADAAIAAWDAKYTYGFWRPVTAIRLADTDGNAATVADPSWVPLLTTPNHPDYVAGHATFSAAAATVLTDFFGEQAFSATSVTLPGVTREFDSFADAAAEAAQSRLYAGIHFRVGGRGWVALGTRRGLGAGRVPPFLWRLGSLGLDRGGTDAARHRDEARTSIGGMPGPGERTLNACSGSRCRMRPDCRAGAQGGPAHPVARRRRVHGS